MQDVSDVLYSALDLKAAVLYVVHDRSRVPCHRADWRH